jgi:hypothetical protein
MNATIIQTIQEKYNAISPYLNERGKRKKTSNRRGRSLVNMATVVNLIANTTSETGLYSPHFKIHFLFL